LRKSRTFETNLEKACTGSSIFFKRRKEMLISQENHLVTLINVFETTPESQQALIEQWIRFTEEVKEEPGFLGTALHRSTNGIRVINYAHRRSQADFDTFLKRHGADLTQFGQNASRIDPHTYEVVYPYERAGS
jgi:heme-degrading monooxygenase HmoA